VESRRGFCKHRIPAASWPGGRGVFGPRRPPGAGLAGGLARPACSEALEGCSGPRLQAAMPHTTTGRQSLLVSCVLLLEITDLGDYYFQLSIW